MSNEAIAVYGAIMFTGGVFMGYCLGLITKWGERKHKMDEAVKIIRGLVDQNKTLREALELVGQGRAKAERQEHE